MSPNTQPLESVDVRPMGEPDLSASRSIFRLAFGTFLGVPDPENFWADREYVYTRWRANPGEQLIAEINGSCAGSNFLTRWGSFGFFGPLTVRPELWDRGIAQKLLGPTMDLFEYWGVRDVGLFTFAQSAKHVRLYQKFGFWPRFLTAIMSRTPQAGETAHTCYSDLTLDRRTEVLSACRQLTDSIHEGLDTTGEVSAVGNQDLGDTVLLWGGDSLEAFAICHCGEGTEAGAGNCYIKFAAVRPGNAAEAVFSRLLGSCEAFALERGLTRVECGVNLGRSRAYRQLLQLGYRTDLQGVSMHKPDSPVYNRPDVHVIDDWR